MNKSKVLQIAGIIVTTAIGTIISTYMNENEIKKQVDRHFEVDTEQHVKMPHSGRFVWGTGEPID